MNGFAIMIDFHFIDLLSFDCPHHTKMDWGGGQPTKKYKKNRGREITRPLCYFNDKNAAAGCPVIPLLAIQLLSQNRLEPAGAPAFPD